jgi:hypothetical protein
VKEITAEQMKYLYFAGNEGLSNEILKQDSVNSAVLRQLWEDILSNQAHTFRLVLIPSGVKTSTLIIYFLYWLEDINLEELDLRIENASFNDDDFKTAVATTFGKLKCSHCGWEGYTLVMRLGDAYVAISQLEDKKLKFLGEDKIKKCPNCGSSLRQLVVKVFPE